MLLTITSIAASNISQLRGSMEVNAPLETEVALEVVTSHEVNRTRDEEDAVVASIKANDLLHRTISNYLLRDIVRATIRVLDHHRAGRMRADPE
jgi:hypothetical protein